MIYIFWTCANQKEAKEIIQGLLNKKLIACASILAETTSIYRWKGAIEESKETKVILKTLPKYFSAIEEYIKESSSYEVSEIVELQIAKGNAEYLSWIIDSLQ